MNKSKNGDLTSGPILKNLAELALPIMISSMLGTAYNITDMAWIGLLGAKAVAGVGVGGHVCLAFPGNRSPAPHGRTGECGPVLWTKKL